MTHLHLRKNSLVIVGNGCAAAECIKAARERGYGGKIHLLTDSQYPVSNPMLTTYYVAGKIGFEALFPYGIGQEFYSKHGVETHTGSPVVALDAEKKVVYAKSGVELNYDVCLVATGASAVLPPVEGVGSDRVYTMRTVDDAIRLKEAMAQKPKKAIVVGASMVGIKLIELFRNAGMDVCLADMAEHIFPLAAHPECAKVIAERLQQKGIKLRLGGAVEKIEEKTWGVRAYFKNSAEGEEADLLIMCIGMKANTGFIDQKQVAVDKGILVDGHMRTSALGLYAAGDVAQEENVLSGGSQIIGLWSNARYQGRTAGRNMAGGNESCPGNIPHNITHFMGMDFISIGDVDNYDGVEKKQDGKRTIQLFWKGGLLTGANLLDCTTESGAIKSTLIKGLKQNRDVSPGILPVIQNTLLSHILSEVRRA